VSERPMISPRAYYAGCWPGKTTSSRPFSASPSVPSARQKSFGSGQPQALTPAPASVRGLNGDRQRRDRPPGSAVAYPQLAPVELCDDARDREPHPDSRSRPLPARVVQKRRADLLLYMLRYPGPLVGHAQFEDAPVTCGRDHDLRPDGRCSQRVSGQLIQSLLKSTRITSAGQSSTHLQRQPQIEVRDCGLEDVPNCSAHLGEVDTPHVEPQPACV
jgi:hypothetical protein